MTLLARTATGLAESGFIPDPAIRLGIRRLVENRLQQILPAGQDPAAALEGFIGMMNRSGIAPLPELANAQHYEVPPEFFAEVLGRHRKYSCCYWDDGANDLEAAEQAAIEITCRRAGIEDGMRILDLGCGWGSLSLWLAEKYPDHYEIGQATSADGGTTYAVPKRKESPRPAEAVPVKITPDHELPKRGETRGGWKVDDISPGYQGHRDIDAATM